MSTHQTHLRPLVGIAAHAVLATLLILGVLAPPVGASAGPENVLVLVNDESEESLEVARYFMQRRGVPAHHVVHLKIPAAKQKHVGGIADYEKYLEAPVKAWLAANPDVHITILLLSRDVPVRVTLNKPADASGLKDGHRSISHMLAALNDPRYERWKSLENAQMRAGHVHNVYARAGWDRAIDPRAPLTAGSDSAPMFSVACLNAFSVEDAKKMVDRAIESEASRPQGTIYLGKSRENDPRGMYNRDFPGLASQLQSWGFQVEIVEHPGNNTLLTDKTDVLVYQYGQAGWDKTFPAKNQYVPGAMIDNLTSVALTPNHFDRNAGGQTTICFFIEAGASSVHGCVAEPYTTAFSPSHVHIRRYLSGFNIIESYFMAHPLMPWMNLVSTDPLMQPFAEKPEVTIERAGPANGGYAIRASARATRSGAGIDRMRLFVNGLQVDEQRGGSAEFEVADFDPACDSFVVVAIDDSKFAAQGRAGRQPAYETGVSADGAEFVGLVDGKAKFEVADRPVVFRWYAPTAKVKSGAMRGDTLELEMEGGTGNVVEIWYHTDPASAPVVVKFDLDTVLVDKGLEMAQRAARSRDVQELLAALAMLEGQDLSDEQKKQVEGWKTDLEEDARSAWGRIEGRIGRRPQPDDVERITEFAERWNGLPIAQEALRKLAQIRIAADGEAREKWEEAVRLHEAKKWNDALEAYESVVDRYGVSSFASEAEKKIAEIKADPQAQGALNSAEQEEEARRLYQMAKNFMANRMRDRAKQYLERVIAEYPDTSYAEEAKRDLLRLR